MRVSFVLRSDASDRERHSLPSWFAAPSSAMRMSQAAKRVVGNARNNSSYAPHIRRLQPPFPSNSGQSAAAASERCAFCSHASVP